MAENNTSAAAAATCFLLPHVPIISVKHLSTKAWDIVIKRLLLQI